MLSLSVLEVLLLDVRALVAAKLFKVPARVLRAVKLLLLLLKE